MMKPQADPMDFELGTKIQRNFTETIWGMGPEWLLFSCLFVQLEVALLQRVGCCCLLYVSRSLRHFSIAVHLFVDYCLWHAALFHLGSPGPWGGDEKPTAGDLFVMTHKCMFLWQHFSKVNTIQGRGNNSTCLLEINHNTPAAATLPVKKPELT